MKLSKLFLVALVGMLLAGMARAADIRTDDIRFGALWADYSRNKDIPAAAYYNPKNSKSVSGDLSLSYALPLDGGISLTQQLGLGSGRYWQADQNGENTWTLKYGHDWRLGKRVGLSYEAGRKKAIYDGDAEYQLFGNVGLNVRFQ